MPECSSINPNNMHPETNPKSVECQNTWDDRAWVQVTLGSTVRTYNIESPKQTLSGFFTMLGALTGSLIGLSVVTLFELIILFLRLFRIL